MNGFYKISEALTIADLAKRLEYVSNNDRTKGRIILKLVQENGALKDSHKSIRTALLNSARDRMKLERLNRHQHNYINLLHEVIKAPDKVQWVRIGLAFALGMVAMSLIAGWYVSL